MPVQSKSAIPHSKPWITPGDLRSVEEVLRSGTIAEGPRVRCFEREIAAFLGCREALAVASGTSALVLTLRALNIGEGQDVITSTYVCRNVMDAILSVGARPVFCDVGETWNMTPETVEPRITSQTAAIIVTHIFGIPADTHGFLPFNFPVIEDACQAFGAQTGGRPAGVIGRIGFFSFHATKCLTTGEGGMAVTQDASLASRLRQLAGEARTAPMTDLQAALGLSQLRRYADFMQQRKQLARRYYAELRDCPVDLSHPIADSSIFFRFPVRVSGPFEACRERFLERGIHVRRGVDMLLHRLAGASPDEFPMAEQLFASTVSIPLYPALQECEVEAILSACRDLFGYGRA